jgi:hypothetical protein
VKCYACGKTWHMSWECLKKKNEAGGEAHISEVQKKHVKTKVKEEVLEEGISLIMSKSLIYP